MSFERSSDFEQSPAKMFVGLFVLIAVLAGGFLLVRLVGRPEAGPTTENTTSVETDRSDTTGILGVPKRDPDGGLRDDPLDIEGFEVEMNPPKTGDNNSFDYPPDNIDRYP